MGKGAFILGLEIVIRLGNGMEGGRTFREGDIEQKWTNKKKWVLFRAQQRVQFGHLGL